MGNLHLVTGHKGESHVTAADYASLNAAILGDGQLVLPRGNKFSPTVISNNCIRIADGDIIMQGRHIRLNEGTYVDLTIENGSQGSYRNDLIVARYTKDSLTGVEDCNLVVIKGTESTKSATDPEYTDGDIINGHALLNDMPLYRVPLDGLNVQTLVPLFEVATTAAEAVPLSGGTMSGHLHIQSSKNPTVYFEDNEGNGCGSVFGSAEYKRTYLRSYATDKSGFYENFRTPAASDGLTKTQTYDILTTKDTVPIANGGTGATTAAKARTSLGLGTVAVEDTVPITKGGTGATTAADALKNLGAVSATTDSTISATPSIQATNYPTLLLRDGNGNKCGSVFGAAGTKATYLRSYLTDDLYENYRTPSADSNLSETKTYELLTTKEAVPIANGGTGATTAAKARTSLGLGTVAVEDTVPITKGGTGATTAAKALSNLGITYGTKDPEKAVGAAGTAGRIYFKKVT